MSKVFPLLQKRYPATECILMQEVSDTTGSRNCSIDYLAVNIWPSRGHSIAAFEQKISRSDWLRELKNPGKQERIYRYCDYFYLITEGDNIAKIEEIPSTWGWVDVRKGKLITLKEAPKLQPLPLQRDFVCAMLRRAAEKEKWVHIDSLDEKIQMERDTAIRNAGLNNTYRDDEFRKLQVQVKEFELASGIVFSHWENKDKVKLGEAVKFVMNGGVAQFENRLEQLKNTSSKIHSDLLSTIDKLNAKQL